MSISSDLRMLACFFSVSYVISSFYQWCALMRHSSLWCSSIPSIIIFIFTCSIPERFPNWETHSTPSSFIILFWYLTFDYLSSQSYLVTMYKNNWPLYSSGNFFPYISSVNNVIFEQRSGALSTFYIQAPINDCCTPRFFFFSFFLFLFFAIGCGAFTFLFSGIFPLP